MIKYTAFSDGFWGDFVWLYGVWESIQIPDEASAPVKGSHTQIRTRRRIYKNQELMPDLDIRLKSVKEKEFPVIV
jgi:hypothetical protein